MTDQSQRDVWIDPATGLLYISYISGVDGTYRFAIISAPEDGLPEPVDTTAAPPQTLVPLVPAWVDGPSLGVPHTLMMREELEDAEDSPVHQFSGTLDSGGRWRVDGMPERLRTSALVVGQPSR